MHGRNENYMRLHKLLVKNNYSIVRKRGSHFIYSNGVRTVSVNKDANPMVCRRLIKENNLGVA